MNWIVFFQVRDFDFVNFDDGAYVSENEHVLSGLSWDNLRWAFSSEGNEATGSWHPLTWLSLMLDAQGKTFGAALLGLELDVPEDLVEDCRRVLAGELDGRVVQSADEVN